MTAHETQTRHEFRTGSRTVFAHEGPPGRDGRLTVFWLGGTPHSGELLAEHLEHASALDVRLLAVARSGFGGSDRDAGRSVAAAAADVVLVADRLGIDRFAITGYSGGDHARRIAAACSSAEVIVLPGRGHIGVLLSWRDALDRILATVTGT